MPTDHRAPPAALYIKAYAAEAKDLCSRGASEGDLARHFQCTLHDIRLWCAVHKDFGAAVQVGAAAADDRVCMALYQRATGFSYDEVKTVTVPEHVDVETGVLLPEREVQTVIRKFVAPDAGAAQYWLENRRPEEWVNRVKVDHKFDGADVRDIPTKELLRIAAGGGSGGIEPIRGAGKPDRVH